MKKHRQIKQCLRWIACLGTGWLTCHPLLADEAPAPTQFSTSVNVNTKGISLVPALTLGKPAAIIDWSVRKGSASFEPQFRLGLNGKPWSLLLWGRYRAINTAHFRLTLGAHPALSFRTVTDPGSASSGERIEARRYLATEIAPTWQWRQQIGTGLYYLYSHGLDTGTIPNTHLLAWRAAFTGVPLGTDWRLDVVPQFYWLHTSNGQGTYISSTASLARRGQAWSLTSIANMPLRTDVPGGQHFIWNLGVTYVWR